MNNTTEQKQYTREEADAALCIFDELLCLSRDANDGSENYWTEMHGYGGTPALRDAALDMAPGIEAAWCAVDGGENYGAPFDFEFVPEIIRLAIETHGSHMLTGEQWRALAQKIISEAATSD